MRSFLSARFRQFLLVVALAVSGPTSAALLYTIGPDAASVPRNLATVDPGGATPRFDLGDGSLGFNGGLAYDTANNRFYAIANDSLGNSSLVSFTLGGAGSVTTLASLGTGFIGGLAYNSADGYLYGISTDFMGNSSLYKISADGSTVTSLGVLGVGYQGGLTYNADDGKLYAISADMFGVQSQLDAIDITGAPSVSTVALGDGSVSFNGGIAYDPGADLFYAISNDSSAASTLDSFTFASASAPTAIAALGFGYLNASLAFGPDFNGGGGSVPEPSSFALLLAAMLSWTLLDRARRRRPA
jgi:hypothetical protein